jgi:hypothetical protein
MHGKTAVTDRQLAAGSALMVEDKIYQAMLA